MKRFLLATAFVLLSTAAFAQTTSTFKVGQSFRVTFDADGLNTIAYQLLFNNVQVGNDIPVGGTRQFLPQPISVPASGITVRVAAVGPSGVPVPSTEFVTLVIQSLDPTRPTNIQILAVQVVDNGNGTRDLKFMLADPAVLTVPHQP